MIVQTESHVKRGKTKGGSSGPASDGQLRIATDLLDVPAEELPYRNKPAA